MIHDNVIRVGACGWDQRHWQGNFFPDDLPDDWRLAYYANEFSAVLVPENEWCAADVDFEQWAEDVPDDFKFYLLTRSLPEDDSLIKAHLGDKFAGFVTADDSHGVVLITFATKNLREWKEWLQMREFKAIFLMDDELTATQLLDFKALLELMNL